MARLALFLIAFLLVQLPSAALGQGALVDQAKAARSAGRLDESERILKRVLQREPQNFSALYTMGLVYQGRAASAAPGEPRLKQFQTAASWLERAYRAPGRKAGGADALELYNSMGSVYLGLGNLTRADYYLQEGLRNEKQLSDAGRSRLYASLGYLYALQGDLARSRRYFDMGSRLGSPFAKENLRRLNQSSIK